MKFRDNASDFFLRLFTDENIITIRDGDETTTILFSIGINDNNF